MPQFNQLNPVYESALQIVSILQEAGYRALWVGGCVRDKLLGRIPKDIDIATDARPEQVQEIFDVTHAVGAKFGVVLVVIDGIASEVATFRTEADYHDARRPSSVCFTTAEEDARRRDFTVNALYYDPVANEIHDCVGGQQDLANKLIRAIGNPDERFREDALRLLRAIRFAMRLGFQIDKGTFKAMQANAERIALISPERIREELACILTGPNRGDALRLLSASGLLVHILPEIEAMRGVPQPPRFHPEGDVFEHTVLALDALPQDASAPLAFGALLHDIGKPPTIEHGEDRIRFHHHNTVGADLAAAVCRRLRFSNADREHIVALVAEHMRFMHVDEMRTSTLRRFLAMPHFDDHLALHRADCVACHGDTSNVDYCLEMMERFAEENAKPGLPEPFINGDDLIALGYKPGPRMGDMLESVREAQLENEIHCRDDAVEYVKNQYPLEKDAIS